MKLPRQSASRRQSTLRAGLWSGTTIDLVAVAFLPVVALAILAVATALWLRYQRPAPSPTRATHTPRPNAAPMCEPCPYGSRAEKAPLHTTTCIGRMWSRL